MSSRRNSCDATVITQAIFEAIFEAMPKVITHAIDKLSALTKGSSIFSCPLLLVAGVAAGVVSGVVGADSPKAPPDEPEVVDNIASITAALPIPASLVGAWGKCLTASDTRCYLMNMQPDGKVTTLTYISQRAKQFDSDPGTDPGTLAERCYRKSERQLHRLGAHSYAWDQPAGAHSSSHTADEIFKVAVHNEMLQIFSKDSLQLVLPKLTARQWKTYKPCAA